MARVSHVTERLRVGQSLKAARYVRLRATMDARLRSRCHAMMKTCGVLHRGAAHLDRTLVIPYGGGISMARLISAGSP